MKILLRKVLILIQMNENLNIPNVECFKERKKSSHTCARPLGTLGRAAGLLCRLVQGQLALIPHLPRAACTMSPIL